MVAALIIIGIFAVIFLAVWTVQWGRPPHLVGALKTLPASGFPERADAYICDKCARDVTKYFRLRPSHSWTPMGPARFVCRCGQCYLTGAIEWDHLGLRKGIAVFGKPSCQVFSFLGCFRSSASSYILLSVSYLTFVRRGSS